MMPFEEEIEKIKGLRCPYCKQEIDLDFTFIDIELEDGEIEYIFFDDLWEYKDNLIKIIKVECSKCFREIEV